METLLVVTLGCLSCVLLSSVQGAVLIALVLVVRLMLGRSLSTRARYLLWCLVLARLAIPVFPPSSFSVFNLASLLSDSVLTEVADGQPWASPQRGGPVADFGRSMASLPLAESSGDEVRGDRPAVERFQPLRRRAAMAPLISEVRLAEIPSSPPESARKTGVAGTIRELSAAFWLVGVILLSLRMFFQSRRVSRLLKTSTAVTDPGVLRLFTECKVRLGITRSVALQVVDDDIPPSVTGVLHPRILVSRAVLQCFSLAQLRFVLLHELIHIRRKDVATNWVAMIVQIVHWFNPLVWFAVRRMRFDRELACDAAVLTHTGQSEVAAYGHTAIKLLGMVNTGPSYGSAVGILDQKPAVLRRIAMIGQFRTRSRAQRLATAVILVLFTTVGLTDALPQSKKAEPEGDGGSSGAVSPNEDHSQSQPFGEAGAENRATIRFKNVTADSGLANLTLLEQNGSLTGQLGSGCAFLDFDSDGDPDIALLNVEADKSGSSIRLLENDGQGRFRDVTQHDNWSGLIGIGVAVGDYDNDGRVDLYISAHGPNRLYHNLGNGVFEDVSKRAGVSGDPSACSTGCGWFDFDNDGDLDLLVVGYAGPKTNSDGVRDSTGRPSLYRNDGNGRFTDVTNHLGLGKARGKSLSIAFSDFDADGWVDIFVANDGTPNSLLRNQDGQQFEDMGIHSGVAVDQAGRTTGSMGIDIAFFSDGSTGIAVGNSRFESLELAVGKGLLFRQDAKRLGVAQETIDDDSFGVGLLDLDLDGHLDLFVANGCRGDLNGPVESDPFELFMSVDGASGPTSWEVGIEDHDLADAQGRSGRAVGRGIAFADVDGDGDVDILLAPSGRTPQLLRNEADPKNHWLRLKLIGDRSNRDAIGSTVTIELEPGRTLKRQVMPTRGYLSQSELVLSFGLGEQQLVRNLTISWADGSKSTIGQIRADQTVLVEQGKAVGADGVAGPPQAEPDDSLQKFRRSAIEQFRRLHLDLTGLPPSEQDIRNYMDGLSGSTDKWIEEWLQAAPPPVLAEDQVANDRGTGHFRDWVARAFHGDPPDDKFVPDQIASEVVRGDKATGRVTVELIADSEGALKSIRFAGNDLGGGAAAYERLGREMHKWATAADRPPVAERQVVIKAPTSLGYEFVARAMTVCGGRKNDQTGAMERFVGDIRFRQSEISDELLLSVGFIRTKDGRKLSDKPVVFWDDTITSIDGVAKLIAARQKNQSGSKAWKVVIRSDADVKADSIRRLLRQLVEIRVAEVRILAWIGAGASPMSHKRVYQLRKLDAKQVASTIRQLQGERENVTITVDQASNSISVSASDPKVLDLVADMLNKLGDTPREKRN